MGQTEVALSWVEDRMKEMGAKCAKSTYRNGVYVFSVYSDFAGSAKHLIAVGNGPGLSDAAFQALRKG